MCGIAGIFHYRDPERETDRGLVERMTRVLSHRGPDAEGFFFQGAVGFGHRRLSIVDLSPTGAQPMSNDDRSCWITYNGEFYNHKDFRPRLAANGHRFRGTSDTETMLRLMEEEGPDALEETAGIFGFAFWDSRTQTLTLARDPLGVKQVYFHDDGARIIFASEIKALLEDPQVNREVDPEAVNQYLHFHTPLFERTFFKGIRQLRAGEYLRISRYGAQSRRYWAVDDFRKLSSPENAMVDDLRHRLGEVVEQQLMSDVPVGSFFSGGIDSSAVAAFASKAGRRPVCFGVHFTGQGVIDERPYQEAAAKALGLELQLITMSGENFPDEFRRLMYHQDQPVIGAAMFPMAQVSKLASASVKVCLGGQAADEIFGGYSRYALGRPGLVMKSWFSNRRKGGAGAGESSVGSNLSRQISEGGTWKRLARNARHLANWNEAYFEHFAKVPEHEWTKIFASHEFCSRIDCSRLFQEVTARSAAVDPMDKLMHWDLQTYLTGLFQQDDRMSMSTSLESRVPFADPRLVRFAFGVSPDLRFRGGSSKWILRKAVSDLLPSMVLGRRKVGFDTPAAQWMAQHAGFVRETLLSSQAMSRGIWNRAGLEALVGDSGRLGPFDILWKVLAIELWASVFLNAPATRATERPTEIRKAPAENPAEGTLPWSLKAQYLAREIVEMGAGGTLARGLWELKLRSGVTRLPMPGDDGTGAGPNVERECKLPFAIPHAAGEAIRGLLTDEMKAQVMSMAAEATRGRVPCFGRWMAEYGMPVDWHRDPITGHRWPANAHWASALRMGKQPSDVKFIWEAARFPQAYILGRGAAIHPESAPVLATAFRDQVMQFMECNPPGVGLNWFSGQEIALRVMAWMFGIHVFSSFTAHNGGPSGRPCARPAGDLLPEIFLREVATHVRICGAHIARHIEYARDSVYNNHLLSEALGLYLMGTLFADEEAARWRNDGRETLTTEAGKQVYGDGGYIQQSHNYHRGAMKLYLWAARFARANGDEVPAAWNSAMERSLTFLFAQQNPVDGRLPNYGANDGSDPVRITQTDFSDFRGVLQALSIQTRGERLFPAGAWDEYAIWHFGPEILNLPQRPARRVSVSFRESGYHVLRGKEESSFCTFRCGTILDRFSQIDMLHVDIWWRGENVLADGGSYRYNGAPLWHDHFMQTGCHNTVQIDGREQMPHVRQFKTLYRTQAKLRRFEDHADWAVCEGEHYGYMRSEHTLHSRSLLYLKNADIWVIVDTLTGKGSHRARLHWLGGEYPYEFDAREGRLQMETPQGAFGISVLSGDGLPIENCSVVAGQEDPPRGWLSRYYGEKAPVASFAVFQEGTLQETARPITFVSLACSGRPEVTVKNGNWTVCANGGTVRFRIAAGSISDVEPACEAVPEPTF